MAYSSRDRVFLLFGGWNGMPLDSSWIFDPRVLSWTDVPQGPSPSARGDAMLVYDEGNDAFILFGGWYESPPETYHRLSDTWVFFYHNRTWVQRHPPVSPSPRSDSAVAYDGTDDIVLLVGGFDGSAYLGDEWYYSFRNDVWTPLSSTVRPSPRADGRMVYDPSQKLFLLFGGNDFSGPNFTFHHLGDTWGYEWTREMWFPIATEVSPSARDYPIFVHDSAAGEFLVFGGYGNYTFLGDIWAFNTTRRQWVDITTAGGPAPRFAAMGGYDIQHEALVVFSGASKEGLKADTWFFRYPPPIIGALLAAPVAPVMGQSVEFEVVIHGGSGNLAREEWSFGDGGTASGLSAFHVFSRPGIFNVLFVAVDDRGQRLVMNLEVSVGVIIPLWADFAILTVSLGAGLAAILLGPRLALWRRGSGSRKKPLGRNLEK